MFIEDTFGQLMMTHINFFQREQVRGSRRGIGQHALLELTQHALLELTILLCVQQGIEAANRIHDKYGAWLLATEDEENIVGHLNGRDYLTSCQLVEKGYVPGVRLRQFTVTQTDRAHSPLDVCLQI
jgi:hypothetical protein